MCKMLLYTVVLVLLIMTDSYFLFAHLTPFEHVHLPNNNPSSSPKLENGLTDFDGIINHEHDFEPNRPKPLSKSNDGLSCSCYSCGALGKKDELYGRIKVPYAHKYPWIGSLIFKGTLYCSTTLINDKYVLTAAHCVDDIEVSGAEHLKVRLFEHDRNTPNYHMDFNVKNVIVHHGYNRKTYDNDIALIQLETCGIPTNPDLHSVCMPTEGVRYTHYIGAVAGWELMAQKDRVLREALVPIISNDLCNAIPMYDGLITENMICAGKKVHDGEAACRGDSGSPLVVNDGGTHRIVGITTFGLGCRRFPAVFTRVANYLDWIKLNTPDACSCDEAST